MQPIGRAIVLLKARVDRRRLFAGNKDIYAPTITIGDVA